MVPVEVVVSYYYLMAAGPVFCAAVAVLVESRGWSQYREKSSLRFIDPMLHYCSGIRLGEKVEEKRERDTLGRISSLKRPRLPLLTGRKPPHHLTLLNTC